MARERRETAEEPATVPGQRPGSAPPPDAPGLTGATGATGATGEPIPAEAQPASAAATQFHKVRHTRLSGTWAAIILFALVLVFLLIFILQNSHTVEVSYFGAHGHLSLGVALLLAAVSGILLVALAGTARIMQLRATARKHRRADIKAAGKPARLPAAGVRPAGRA